MFRAFLFSFFFLNAFAPSVQHVPHVELQNYLSWKDRTSLACTKRFATIFTLKHEEIQALRCMRTNALVSFDGYAGTWCLDSIDLHTCTPYNYESFVARHRALAMIR